MEISEHAQLAKAWLNDPPQCAAFLDGLIETFYSLYTVCFTGTIDDDDESGFELDRTKNYQRRVANELADSIGLARQALEYCELKKPDFFKIDAGWQKAFHELCQRIESPSRYVGGMLQEHIRTDCGYEFWDVFSSFESVVINLNNWIHISVPKTSINLPAPSETTDVSIAVTDVESSERSRFAEIEDNLSGQQLKIFQFLVARNHPTDFTSLMNQRQCFRESSKVTVGTVFEALKRLRSTLSKMSNRVTLRIEDSIGRTQLEGLSTFKSRGKTGGK